MQAAYTNVLPLTPALAAAFSAKKSAEVAPGVGATTDIHILTKDGHSQLWPDVHKKMHELYDEYQRSRVGIATAAVLRLDEFIAKRKPQSEAAPGLGVSSASVQRKDEEMWRAYWPGKNP
jgi:hypothetical protein